MSQVFVFQTLSAAQQAKAKTPSGLWVGGATSMIHHPKKEPWLDIGGCADLNKLMMIHLFRDSLLSFSRTLMTTLF